MKLLDGLLDLLFPPKCPFCQKILDHPGICRDCQSSLPWNRDLVRELPGGVRCAAPLRYESQVREALLRLKFHGRSAAAEPIGALMAQCAADCFADEFDTVTWVPVSARRLRQRGYDQAELLARAACRLWNTKPLRLLEKTADNPAQSGLEDASARWRNVQGVYRASAAAAGRRVLLVDDICTTGATLSSAAQALQTAGAEQVVCLTAALTAKN